MALVYWAAAVMAVATSVGASPYQRPNAASDYQRLPEILDKRVDDDSDTQLNGYWLTVILCRLLFVGRRTYRTTAGYACVCMQSIFISKMSEKTARSIFAKSTAHTQACATFWRRTWGR